LITGENYVTRSIVVFTFAEYYLVQIDAEEMGEACGTGGSK
jgi:hypothetical protein